MDSFSVRALVEITTQQVDDLFCCAFEGGSTYWIDRVEVPNWPEEASWAHEVMSQDFPIIIHFEDHQESKELIPSEIEATLQKIADEYPTDWKDIINDNTDANTGDLFVQLLTFGEVVYG